MTYVVKSAHQVDAYFMDWLLDVIKIRCQQTLKPHKLVLLDKHIIENNVFNLTDKQKRSFNLYREMLKVSRSLKWRKIKDCYVIYVPSNIFITNTSIPISKLSRFVCYGDLTIRGYPILGEVIQGVIANITKYIKQYEQLFYGGV